MKPRHIIGFLTAIGLTFGQTLVDLKTQTKNVDFSRALSVRPFPTGTGLPSVCNPGEMFFKSDAISGANLYGCIAPNSWVLESVGPAGPTGPVGSAGPAGPTGATGPVGPINRIADEGTPLTQRGTVNFLGPAITCIDNSGASRTDCTVTGGAGITVLTTGSGDPTTSCSAPSAINLAKYYDATAKKMWTCVDVNTWQLDLTVDPTATLLIGGNVGVAPATPGSGKVHVYSDSTLKGLSAKDDAGQITRTVKPTDCSSTGFVSKVNADGTVTCAAGGSPYDPTDVTVLDTAPFFPARLTNDNDKSGLWSLNTPSCVGVSVSTFGLAPGQAAYLWQDAHAGAACLVSFPSTYNNAGGPLADFLSGGTPLPFTLQTLFGRDATHDGDIAVGMSQSASNADNFAGCYYSASAGNWQAVIRSGGAVVGSAVTVVAGDSSMHWVRASGTGVANTVTCSVGSSSATVTQTIPAGTWFAIHGAVSTGVDTPRFRSSEVRFHLAGRVAD